MRNSGIGLSDVKSEGTVGIQRGDSPDAKSSIQTLNLFKSDIMSTGEVAEQDWLRLEALLQEDPSFYFVTTAMWAAWGRKPK